jgi:hypothetical protein
MKKFCLLNWQECFVGKFNPTYSTNIYTTNLTITIKNHKTIKHYCNVDNKIEKTLILYIQLTFIPQIWQ